jgi:hypothetical protein
VKKKSIVLFAMAAVISTSTGNPFDDEWMGNVVYASNQIDSTSTEKFKADFAYEMAQITETIISAPTTNVENFKIEFSYATAKVTTKVMQIIPGAQRKDFSYEMAQFTTRIISDQNLNIEKAKAEFAYKIAQLTTKVITSTEQIAISNATTNAIINTNSTTLLRNNADIEQKAVGKTTIDTNSKAIIYTGDISPETYTGLIDELKHVGDRSSQLDHKVNIDGEIRYHYALNSGLGQGGRDSSGFRARLAFDTEFNKDWRVYGGLEGKKNIMNYDNGFEFSRLYVAGKVGKAMIKAGSFGYLMAEGNIYDSDYDGVRADFGGPIKYTVSYGATNDTKKTYIATALYNDFDYNVEAGVYRNQMDDSNNSRNTIRTLSGNYNFSNFGVGAMVLNSSLKDTKGNSNGYVFSLNYGDLKSWRPGTYGVFAKYYNQPRYTYIAHGMNGSGSKMQGFKGYGVGMNYTIAENFVAGIEYYSLTDKINGDKGETWWSQLTQYF